MWLIFALICGILTAVLANHKGRSVVGWFFLGFFFGIFGLIAILVGSNKKEQREREEQLQLETKRLQEQLRQERLKNEAFRAHTQSRLDTHDQALQLDTRQTSPALLAGSPEVFPQVNGGAAKNLPEISPLEPATLSKAWFYYANEKVVGPYSLEQLKTFVGAGSMDPRTAVCPEGDNNWMPLQQVLEFHLGADQ